MNVVLLDGIDKWEGIDTPDEYVRFSPETKYIYHEEVIP